MARAKNYAVTQGTEASAFHAQVDTPDATSRSARLNIAEVIHGQRNASSARHIDLRRWLGRGMDEWVYAFCDTLRYLLQRGDLQAATVINYGVSGVPKFLEFLSSFQHSTFPSTPTDLHTRHLTQFVAWVKLQYPTRSTAKSVYSGLKAVIVAMIARGIIDGDRRHLLPAQPFPNSSARKKGVAPLSVDEKQQLVAALKHDLISLHQGKFNHPDSEALVVYLLVVALRSGGNTTPLLEMTRDSLQPHVVPNMMCLHLVKHRSATTQIHSLRRAEMYAENVTIPMDGVAVFNKVLAATERLLADAPAKIRNRVWLYRIEGPKGRGQITALTKDHMTHCVRNLVERHGLVGDDGRPLDLKLSRLRKSKAHELWLRSDGDLVAVANIMGHQPSVTDRHYLAMTDTIRAEGATFVGEALTAELRRGTIPIMPLENTPVGSCKDPLYGDKAPKTGASLCDQFIHCLSCRSYAIVGSVPDLHRLFSFQIYMRSEIDYYPQNQAYDEWRAHRRRLIELIDHFTADHFKPAVVQEAKTLADREPHRFWSLQIEVMRRMGGQHEL